jgi:hypothetical protein
MRRHLARCLALAACLALTGSVADAKPPRHGRRHHKVKKAKPRRAAPPVERHIDRDDDRAAADDDANEMIAIRDDEVDEDRDDVEVDRDEVPDGPVRLRKVAAPRSKDWHVAIGPYLWASSVEANVSLGSQSVEAGVDFIEMQRHARYGAEVLGEARYRRFSISGDLMYGVVAVNGAREIGPLMVTADGTASSLLVEGAAGYLVAGDDHSLLSIEARGGVRYQRTEVAGSLGIDGSAVQSLTSVDAGGDAVTGARVIVRPWNRFYVSGTADIGVYGVSNSTWSASADASLRITSHVLLSLGWRTLTIDRASVAVTMRGPRAALQLLF